MRYLAIGGYAVGIHDRPRTTKISTRAPKTLSALAALAHVGAPESVLADLFTARPGEIVWWGNPPLRIAFGTTCSRRAKVRLGDVEADVISLEDFITAKRAAGREQDLLDG